MKIPLTLLFILIFSSLCFGQNIDREKLLDVYWGIPTYQVMNFINSDTSTLTKFSSKDSLLANNYCKGGFILHNDGSFEEIVRPFEKSDRKGYKGNWKLEQNLITVLIDEKITWYFQIIEVTEHEFKTKYWAKIEKH